MPGLARGIEDSSPRVSLCPPVVKIAFSKNRGVRLPNTRAERSLQLTIA